MRLNKEKRYIKIPERKYRMWRRRDKSVAKAKFYVREAWRILSQVD